VSQPLIGAWTCPTSCASLKLQFSCGDVRLRIPGCTRAVYLKLLEINPTHPKRTIRNCSAAYSVLSARSSSSSLPQIFRLLDCAVFCGSAADLLAPDGGLFGSMHKVQPSRFTACVLASGPRCRLAVRLWTLPARQTSIALCFYGVDRICRSNRALVHMGNSLPRIAHPG